MPNFLFFLVIAWYKSPASRFTLSPRLLSQHPDRGQALFFLFRYSQKFLAEAVSARSTLERGIIRKELLSVFMSPLSCGVIEDIISASLARGK